MQSIDIDTKSFCQQRVGSIKEKLSQIDNNRVQMATTLQYAQESIKQNTAENHAANDAIGKEIQTEELEFSKQLACMERHIVDKIDEHKERCCAMVDEFDAINSVQNVALAGCAGTVIKRITDEIERNDIDCIGAVKAISGVREHTHDCYGKLNETIEAIKTDLDTYAAKAMKTYTPTGQTPAKKEFNYPLELAATSPHERIIRRFWQQHSDVSVSQLDCSTTISEVLAQNVNTSTD